MMNIKSDQIIAFSLPISLSTQLQDMSFNKCTKLKNVRAKLCFSLLNANFGPFCYLCRLGCLNTITKTKPLNFQGFFVIINPPRSPCSERMTRCVLLIRWQNLQTLKDHLLFCETEKSQLWLSFLRLFDGVMNLYTMKKISCSLIPDLSGNDFQKVKELCRSLRHLQVQKAREVALSELCSFLKSLLASVLRCMTVKSLSCGR